MNGRRWALLVATLASLTGVVCVAYCCGVLFFVWGGMGTARHAVERGRCEESLELIYERIQSHIAAHADLPRDASGLVSLSSLSSVGDLPELPPCTGSDLDDAYLVAPDLSVNDFRESDDETPRVIIWDKPGNHELRLANGLRDREDGIAQEQALLLLNGGYIVCWIGDAPAYQQWSIAYLHGTGPPYPPGLVVE